MTVKLLFPGASFRELHEKLFQRAPLEAGGILLCNPSTEKRLLVDEVRVASAEDCRIEARDQLEFAPGFLASAVKAARERHQSVILVHTHPMVETPVFSDVDNRGEAAVIPALQMRVPGTRHGALVLGTSGFEGRIYEPDTSRRNAITEVVEAGPQLSVRGRGAPSVFAGDTFDRNVRAFGAAGQAALQVAKVAVVGLGGTGSIVAQQLAHLGVGTLTLIDHDRLDETNLNRVVGAAPEDVGLPKVDVAAAYIRRISAGRIRVETVAGDVVDARVASRLLEADLVFGCTDSHGSRAVINQLAYQHFLPAIDMGVRIDADNGRIRAMAGRVQMLAPGLACLQCQGLLDPEAVRRDLLTDAARRTDPYIVGEPEPQPAVISLNGTVSSLAVTMFLAAFAGVPVDARRLNYRIGESAVRPVSATPLPHCVVCSGSQGAFGRGDQWPMFWRRAT